MNVTPRDYMVSGLFLTGFIFFSSLLYLDYNKNLSAAGAKPLGEVVYKRYEVKRKYSDRLVWENIDQKAVVYSYDSILTGENSDAKLKLDNGLELDLKPNSMVELNFSGNETKIKVKSGAIVAKNSGDTQALLETESGEQIKMDKAAIALEQGEKGSTVRVEEGNISVSSAGKEEITVKSGEMASMSAEAVKKENVSVFLSSPGDGYTVYTDKDKESLSFRYSIKGEKAGDFILELSRNPAFTGVTIKRKTSGETASVPLPRGQWYWRVVSEDGNIRSEARRISLEYFSHPVIFFPENNRVVESGVNQTSVTFRWQSKTDFPVYSIRLAKDAGFSSPIFSLETGNTTYRADNLAPGQYYFSVASISTNPMQKITASPMVSAFTVTQKKDFALPRIFTSLNPPFSGQEVKNSRAILKWEDTAALSYNIIIYDPGKESNILHSGKTTVPYYTLPPDIAPGTYTWSLVAHYPGGIKKESGSVYFQIRADTPIGLLEPPDKDKRMPANDQNLVNLDFRWNPESSANYYILSISRDKSFNEIIHREKTTSSAFRLIRLVPGDYFWKVESYVGETKISASEIRSFSILRGLPEIREIYPKPTNQKMDVGEMDFITFRWDKVDGATHYEFKMYQNINGKPVLLLVAVEDQNFYLFRDLEKLKESKVIWQVTPIVRNGETVIRKGITKEGGFNVDYGKTPEPPKIEVDANQ